MENPFGCLDEDYVPSETSSVLGKPRKEEKRRIKYARALQDQKWMENVLSTRAQNKTIKNLDALFPKHDDAVVSFKKWKSESTELKISLLPSELSALIKIALKKSKSAPPHIVKSIERAHDAFKFILKHFNLIIENDGFADFTIASRIYTHFNKFPSHVSSLWKGIRSYRGFFEFVLTNHPDDDTKHLFDDAILDIDSCINNNDNEIRIYQEESNTQVFGKSSTVRFQQYRPKIQNQNTGSPDRTLFRKATPAPWSGRKVEETPTTQEVQPRSLARLSASWCKKVSSPQNKSRAELQADSAKMRAQIAKSRANIARMEKLLAVAKKKKKQQEKEAREKESRATERVTLSRERTGSTFSNWSTSEPSSSPPADFSQLGTWADDLDFNAINEEEDDTGSISS